MTMRRSPLHGITVFTLILAAAGCGAFAAGADASHGTGQAAWSLDAGARPVAEGAETRSGAGIGRAPEAEVPLMARAEAADTFVFRPGAVLDVWLNDRTRDPRTISSEPSLGTAVVQGDFFRYTSVNLDPELRRFWGQPLLLKWSAYLQVTEEGDYVFVSELSKERATGAMTVRTLVRLNDQTLFEKDVRIFLTNPILERGSRAVRLAPGRHKLEVWLAVQTSRNLPPSTQLGTYLSIRPPSLLVAVPLDPLQLSHPVRERS